MAGGSTENDMLPTPYALCEGREIFFATVFSLVVTHQQAYIQCVKHGYEPEAVLEAARDRLEVAHAASAGRLSALSLLAPLVRPQLCRRVAALRAR